VALERSAARTASWCAYLQSSKTLEIIKCVSAVHLSVQCSRTLQSLSRDAAELEQICSIAAAEMQQISQFSPEMQQRCSRSLRNGANFAEIRERSAASLQRSISALLCRAERFAKTR
jgi:hypothetical protein